MTQTQQQHIGHTRAVKRRALGAHGVGQVFGLDTPDVVLLRLARTPTHLCALQDLLPYCSFGACTDALCVAASVGYVDVVRMLLPYASPRAHCSRPLQWASAHQDDVMMDLLWDISDPKAALAQMRRMQWLFARPHWAALERRLDVSHQRTVLAQATDVAGRRPHRRKL